MLSKTYEPDIDSSGNVDDTPTNIGTTGITTSAVQTMESSPGPSVAAASVVAGLAIIIYHRKKLNEGKKKKG